MTESYSMLGEGVRRALFFARYEASKLCEPIIESPHLLLGLLRTGDETVTEVMRRQRLQQERLRVEVMGEAHSGPILTVFDLPLSSESRELVDRAEAMAGPRSASSADLLLAILHLPGCAAARLLEQVGTDLARMTRQLESLREQRLEREDDESPFGLSPLLDRHGRDLTALARQGRLEPLIGRQREMAQVERILCQRKKNHPLLVGEPGVGKTAIVEGLAQRLADGQGAAPLADHRVVTLDLASLVAGTQFRGQFEERLEHLLDELRSLGECILFIDEMHTLVGAGSSGGALDAANILKPALSRGELTVIGATTVREMRQHIEKDRALLRRFQPVKVEPMDAEETLELLDGIRDRYEAFHGIRYQPEALRAAVDHSVRYMPDRRLPDKAVELLDQVGAWVRLHGPLSRRETEGAQTGKGKRKAGKRVAERLIGTVRGLEGRSRREVGPDDVAAVVAETTGIPLERLGREDVDRLERLEAELGEMVVGQKAAIDALAKAIRRSRFGVRDSRRPIGSFLCVGPSGVGKTELARQLASQLFDEEQAFLRFDMSEYSERHSVARLLGAPPGYVGFEEGGRLVEAIRRRPYSVVLFDEIEKAHPDLGNLLLQILEDGRLTGSDGRVADFGHTVILLTSNVGSQRLMSEGPSMGFGGSRKTELHGRLREALDNEVRRHFRPELLDRLDDVLIFQGLGRSDLRRILDLHVEELAERLAGQGIELKVSDGARRLLLDQAGLTAHNGARPLRRAVQRHVQDGVSEVLVAHRGQPPERIRVGVANGRLRFRPRAPVARPKRAKRA